MKSLLTLLIIVITNTICFGQDEIYMMEPQEFEDVVGPGRSSSALAMSPDLFVIAYSDGSNKGLISLIHIQEDTVVVFGRSDDFGYPPGPDRVRLSKLTDSKFLLSYISAVGDLYVIPGLINGTSFLSLFSPVLIKSGVGLDFGIIAISEDAFILTYVDASNNNMGNCILGRVNQDFEVAIADTYSFTNSQLNILTRFGIDILSESECILSYGYKSGASLLVSIDDNMKLSFSAPEKFTNNTISTLTTIGLTEKKFINVFNEYNSIWKGALNMSKIDSNGTIMHDNVIFFEEEETSGITAARLDTTKLIISYEASLDGWHGYLRCAEIQKSAVAVGERVMHNEYIESDGENPLATLNSNRFIVMYRSSPYYTGYLRLCSTTEFNTSTFSMNEQDNSFQIYPNPASELLTIQLEEEGGTFDIKMVDMCGRTVFFEEYNEPQITLDLNDFQKGAYLIQLYDRKGVVSKKLLIR